MRCRWALPGVEWSFGDVDAGLAAARYVLDESFVTAALSHHCLEPRSCMAYWQGEKVFVYGSTQSQTAVVPNLARLAGVEPDNLVYISEFCGGGFGSKINAYPVMGVPIYMAKKTGMPVLMRVSRAEEALFGSSRPAFQGRIKMGFRADGRITAVDLYIVQQNGPYNGGGDLGGAAGAVSLIYQPLAMRYRGVQVSTNTTPTGAQRGPGQNQIAAALEPLIDKAAKQLGLDRVAIRRINAAGNDAKYDSQQGPVTSAYQREALERGAAAFNWEERKSRSGQARGSKVTGIGIGQAFHAAGRGGLDGIVRITPDGKLHIHCGVGNLGTFSYAATSRVAAEVLKVALGQLRHRARRHAFGSAVLLAAIGQQHLVHDDARDLRRRDGRAREAQGDRRRDARRCGRRLRRRGRDRVRDGRSLAQHDVRRGRAACDRARRPLLRATRCPRTSTPSRSPASR